ncbi:hypothetical protein PAXINDRAFT_173302 [Paxillus involutus ATCC 200175]|uniref:Uncharacterized protein n=1 Tax=Paxillus involutus ATCC 200175 TaxID=664439 RepID=A0A0C9T9K1_PAXIN|nr:hypothetical protein PAXINDRAFT_173302 [Paxillus involutus ATCC 200175]
MNFASSPPRLLVDKCTPRDKYARTHVPLRIQSSLCAHSLSVDDSLLSPPITPRSSGPSNARRRAHSSSDSQGWKLLPTPIRPTFRPRDYELPPCPEDDDRSETQTVSLKVLNRSLKNVEFDPSCLDRLDHQLLLSPTESFSEICYSEATHDQGPVLVLQPFQPRIRKRAAYYDRTAMSDEDPYHDWDENMSMRRAKPRQKPLPPVPELPKHSNKPESPEPRMSYQQSMLADLEFRLLSHNPDESVHYFPVPSQRRSEESRKSSFDAPSVSSTPSKVSSTKSGSTLKRLGSALVSRSRAKSSA